MILNVTAKPFFAFNAAQKLATRGQLTISKDASDLDSFLRYYDEHRAIVRMVIVDPEDVVTANEIANSVDCPVVTLDVEIDGTTGRHAFVEFNPLDDE